MVQRAVLKVVLRAILLGGLMGGALDLAYAMGATAFYGLAPTRVGLVIASGWLGQAAFNGGGEVVALGFASHFGMSVLWAAIFATAASRWRMLVSRPLLSAIVYGLIVLLCMRLIVLPLSAYPRPVSFKPIPTLLDLLSHMFLFSLPITLALKRAMTPR